MLSHITFFELGDFTLVRAKLIIDTCIYGFYGEATVS